MCDCEIATDYDSLNPGSNVRVSLCAVIRDILLRRPGVESAPLQRPEQFSKDVPLLRLLRPGTGGAET
jgi:hypothetical protein